MDTGAHPLTGREIEVLRCMASGRTYRQIAGLLALSPHTVRRHMEHIYKKLGVQSKMEAVNRGKERNFFAVDAAPLESPEVP